LKRCEEKILVEFRTENRAAQTSLTMRNEYSGRHFAFIVNVECLPDPFLVEISRRTKTERKTVEFYEPNVLYCPREMEPILKAILDDGELFKNHRQVVKKTMVSTMQSTPNPSSLKYIEMQELAMTAIIDSEISKRSLLGLNSTLSLESRTRSAASTTSKIKIKWKQLWLKRNKEERHLVPTFAENVKRSLRELNYVIHILK
jgi:hypothetical protein